MVSPHRIGAIILRFLQHPARMGEIVQADGGIDVQPIDMPPQKGYRRVGNIPHMMPRHIEGHDVFVAVSSQGLYVRRFALIKLFHGNSATSLAKEMDKTIGTCKMGKPSVPRNRIGTRLGKRPLFLTPKAIRAAKAGSTKCSRAFSKPRQAHCLRSAERPE